MPFYHCFSPAGLIDSDQKREIAVTTTDIHCRLTGAPRHFVHVVHQTYEEADAFSGGMPSRACMVRGFIRAGRTQEVKEELLRELSELWTRVSSVSAENLLVSLAENAGTNVMEGGVLLSAPKDDAKWEAEHTRSSIVDLPNLFAACEPPTAKIENEGLITHSKEPFNAEPPLGRLRARMFSSWPFQWLRSWGARRTTVSRRAQGQFACSAP